MRRPQLQVEEFFAGRHVSTRRFSVRRGVPAGADPRRDAYLVTDEAPELPWLVRPGSCEVPVAGWMSQVRSPERTGADGAPGAGLRDESVGKSLHVVRPGLPVTVRVGPRCFLISLVARPPLWRSLREAVTRRVTPEMGVFTGVAVAVGLCAIGFLLYALLLDRPAPEVLEPVRSPRGFVTAATPQPLSTTPRAAEVAMRPPRPRAVEKVEPRRAPKKTTSQKKARRTRTPKATTKADPPRFAAAPPRSTRPQRRPTPAVSPPTPSRVLPSFASSRGKTVRGVAIKAPAAGRPPRAAAPTFAKEKFVPSPSCIQRAVQGMNAAMRRCQADAGKVRGGGFAADCGSGRATRKGLSFRCGLDRRCTAAEVRTTLKTRATRAWWRGICGG